MEKMDLSVLGGLVCLVGLNRTLVVHQSIRPVVRTAHASMTVIIFSWYAVCYDLSSGFSVHRQSGGNVNPPSYAASQELHKGYF